MIKLKEINRRKRVKAPFIEVLKLLSDDVTELRDKVNKIIKVLNK